MVQNNPEQASVMDVGPPHSPTPSKNPDFIDHAAVRRVSRVAEALSAGRGIGWLAEIYCAPDDVLLRTGPEMIEGLANDLHKLVHYARQGNVAMQNMAEWLSLQPVPPSFPVAPLADHPEQAISQRNAR